MKSIDPTTNNRTRDAIEDLRLENKISYDQEMLVWGVISEVFTTVKYKNPYKIKYFDEAREEKSQSIRAMLSGQSFTDLEEYCKRLSDTFSFFILKLEDREDTLKENETIDRSGNKY